MGGSTVQVARCGGAPPNEMVREILASISARWARRVWLRDFSPRYHPLPKTRSFRDVELSPASSSWPVALERFLSYLTASWAIKTFGHVHERPLRALVDYVATDAELCRLGRRICRLAYTENNHAMLDISLLQWLARAI